MPEFARAHKSYPTRAADTRIAKATATASRSCHSIDKAGMYIFERKAHFYERP